MKPHPHSEHKPNVAGNPPTLLKCLNPHRSKTFFLDNFALRQWDDPNYGGTRVSFDKAEFVKRIQDEFDKVRAPPA